MTTAPQPEGWLVRHSTALIFAAVALLIVDARTTNLIVPARDDAFNFAREHDTLEDWRRYVAEGGDPERARTEVERHHAAARATLRKAGAARPDGLDRLLEVLAAEVDYRIFLEADPLEVDAESFSCVLAPAEAEVVAVEDLLQERHWGCDDGMNEAFAQAIGDRVVRVTTADGLHGGPTPRTPRLELQWTARATGTFFGGRRDTRLFPAFDILATVRLVAGERTLAEYEGLVELGDSVEYSVDAIAAGFGFDEEEIASGMIETGCRRVATAMLTDLTGWHPPIEADPEDSLESRCQRSDAQACLILAEPLTESDPERAVELLQRGCRGGGLSAPQACISAGRVALAHPSDPLAPAAKSRLLFEDACRQHAAEGCTLAADLITPPNREAFLLRLRGCDLGAGDACAAAAGQAKGSVASLLEQRACATLGTDCPAPPAAGGEVHGFELAAEDRAFDVRWGMWFEHAASDIVWVASRESAPAVLERLRSAGLSQRSRVYELAEVPPGPRAPADAASVYALSAAPDSVFPDPRPCPACTADAPNNQFWPLGCTCLPAR
ncbi:MAG: hypothetical protein AAF721_33245 [Myxococcota bacterium]